MVALNDTSMVLDSSQRWFLTLALNEDFFHYFFNFVSASQALAS